MLSTLLSSPTHAIRIPSTRILRSFSSFASIHYATTHTCTSTITAKTCRLFATSSNNNQSVNISGTRQSNSSNSNSNSNNTTRNGNLIDRVFDNHKHNRVDHILPMTLTFHRDSVSAGDDIESHSTTLSIASTSDNTTPTIQSLMDVIQHQCLIDLPLIQGGEATWLVTLSNIPIAVIAQQWSTPKYILDQNTKIETIFNPAIRPDVECLYYGKQHPEEVFQQALQKKPAIPQRK